MATLATESLCYRDVRDDSPQYAPVSEESWPCRYINNQRENYSFRFNGILPPDTKQDEVFERVARPVVEGAMDGINGTVFAYGQTGSGKTFTITGGPERYAGERRRSP